MNEQYKVLAKEATQWCEDNAQGTPIAWEWEEKFAELIIRECLQICVDVSEYYDAGGIVEEHIKDYFGVTE